MPLPQISIQNGSIINNQPLSRGGYFQWANPTTQPVQLSGCSGFCTQDSYPVPPGTPTNPGLANAQLLSNPTNFYFSESPNQWNAPGMPHIQNPSKPGMGHEEVA